MKSESMNSRKDRKEHKGTSAFQRFAFQHFYLASSESSVRNRAFLISDRRILTCAILAPLFPTDTMHLSTLDSRAPASGLMPERSPDRPVPALTEIVNVRNYFYQGAVH
jgi:hypothetical protein